MEPRSALDKYETRGETMEQVSLGNRMVGAARLDIATYESVERDVSANSQALLVVVLGALASGVGSLGTQGLLGLAGGIVGALVSWVVYAGVAYVVGTKLFATDQTRATFGELLRTLGFAQAPRLLLLLAWIPLLGALIGLAVAIWLLFTTVIAIRQALDFTTGRAIGTALIAWFVMVIISGIFFAFA